MRIVGLNVSFIINEWAGFLWSFMAIFMTISDLILANI